MLVDFGVLRARQAFNRSAAGTVSVVAVQRGVAELVEIAAVDGDTDIVEEIDEKTFIVDSG